MVSWALERAPQAHGTSDHCDECLAEMDKWVSRRAPRAHGENT